MSPAIGIILLKTKWNNIRLLSNSVFERKPKKGIISGIFIRTNLQLLWKLKNRNILKIIFTHKKTSNQE
jgi:hypothetical protein